MVRGGGKLMGVVCGHPNHCITQTNFRWKFGRFITTVRPGGLREIQFKGFAPLCSGGGNARYLGS